MIFQTGSTARLPRTPRTPRSSADHYFAESVPPTPGESEHSYDGTNGGAGSRTVTEVMGAELSPDEVSNDFYFFFAMLFCVAFSCHSFLEIRDQLLISCFVEILTYPPPVDAVLFSFKPLDKAFWTRPFLRT
jgi:hypothetical protein